MEWTEGIPSPESFRLWSAITCIAGALERRVWGETSKGVLFPNLYTMLISPPGTGKSNAIERSAELWSAVKIGNRGLNIAPDSMTSASMLDALIEAKRSVIHEGRLVTEFHALLVAADEFIVFCPAYDLEFLGRLTTIFDCKPSLRVKRKYLKEEVNIARPYMTMLTGAQPGILKTLFPEEAWSGGFTSRLIMIYAGEGPTVDLFASGASRDDLRPALVSHLTALSKLYGKFHIETEAGIRLNNWWKAGAPPKPTHGKLAYYNTRRAMHAFKLAMISSASRGVSMIVTMPDIDRAFEWLFTAEQKMPDIFRSMVGRSDGEVLRELHYFMWQIHIRRKKPLDRALLVNFLADRVPQEKILHLIEIAQLGNKIKLVGPNQYEPCPLVGLGDDS